MPILSYFVGPKHPSVNCYVSCFLTDKTGLVGHYSIIQNTTLCRMRIFLYIFPQFEGYACVEKTSGVKLLFMLLALMVKAEILSTTLWTEIQSQSTYKVKVASVDKIIDPMSARWSRVYFCLKHMIKHF